MCHILLSETKTLFCAHRQPTNYFFYVYTFFKHHTHYLKSNKTKNRKEDHKNLNNNILYYYYGSLFMKHLKLKQEADTLVQIRNCIQASSPEQDRQEHSTVDHMMYNIP